jgi:tetratricopeptide (TPR) repeat protein
VQGRRFTLNGRDYVWTGTEWCEGNSFTTPPASIVRQLNAEFEDQLDGGEVEALSVGAMVQQARVARDAGQCSRALAILKRAQTIDPSNPAAAAVLCSTLRQQGQPALALAETERWHARDSAPLLKSRAAALCDLGRWDEAKREVARSLAIETGEEAFLVVRRIRKARPDLYR